MLINKIFYVPLAEKVFMKMTIDPLLPSTVATTFYGPTSMVEHYRNLYRESLDEWNQNDEIHRNLLKIFGKYCIYSNNEN